MWNEALDTWRSQGWLRLGINTVAALLVGLAMCWIVFAVLRRLTRGHTMATDVLKRAAAPVKWLVPLLLLTIALHTGLQNQSRSTVPVELLQHLLLVLLIGVFTWLILRCIGVLEYLASGQYRMDVADNLHARRALTQVRVLGRTVKIVIALMGIAAILLTIPGVRQIGTSLLASAGVAGLAVGLAARPVLSNLIAGMQIAITQPIRLDDVVIVDGEWGRIQEITATYVVVHLWDERRLVVPLNWFMENPFQNWTRTDARLLGSVFLWLDYRVPMEPLRQELKRLCEQAPEWDSGVCVLQVTDANERAMQLRALASSANSSLSFDLRCRIREGLIAFVQRHYPDSLPHLRAQLIEPAPPRVDHAAAQLPGQSSPGP